MSAFSILTTGVALLGTALMTVSVAAILRSDTRAPRADPNVKVHAASVLQVVGVPFVLAAPLGAAGAELGLRAVAVAIFALLTASLSTHALARIARDEASGEAENREAPSADEERG